MIILGKLLAGLGLLVLVGLLVSVAVDGGHGLYCLAVDVRAWWKERKSR